MFNILDDHSRLVARSRAVLDATSEEAWTTFSEAAQCWGLPAGCLSDNGLCFSGKLRHLEVLFEARLRDVGVRPFTGRPYHPQTTGKVERFQQTLKRWLVRQPLAASLEQLQTQLDEFCRIYNHERPHQGIGRVTPFSRWNSATRSTPAAAPLAHPNWSMRTGSITVNADGVVRVDGLLINVGVAWAGRQVTVLIDHGHASIFTDSSFVRHLRIDRSRRYQPSGRLRGGPRQRPLP